ncbi:hypothetical protein [Nitrincola alkalisediminis]|uniref:hypothetical protein n=1 Tax=Nitrincola alkalisediminis TaxID=1366656 RepID=UPI00187344B3|nr:hypothetical protein [Nitrincola alkalisediminis]
MDTFSQLEALQKIASSRDDQKILITFHEDTDVGTQTSLLISMKGSIPFYQLNETYIDDFGLCHDSTPINAHSALEIIQSYHFFVESFLNAFVDILVPDEKPASETMDHFKFVELEKKIQKYLDQAYENTKLVFEREKDVSFLVYTFSNLLSIRDVLSIHRVKDPSQEIKPITHLMPLINQLSQDAKS